VTDAVALEPELLHVSLKVVVDLSIPTLSGPPAALRFVALNLPPVIAQEVGYAAVVVALQERYDVSSPSTVLRFAVKKLIFTGCVTVTGADVTVAVAVTPPDALLQASVYVVETVIGAAVRVPLPGSPTAL
jgi:hypothetical protein